MRYPDGVFRPFIRVARPDDWTGRLASMGTGLVLLVLVLSSLMARLPGDLVDLAGGQGLAVRMALILFSIWVVVWLRAAVYSRLPASAYLLGRRLVFPGPSGHRVVRVGDIEAIHVERRPEPAREVFVVEMRDGETHDVCPVHWDGAGRLYRGVSRRIG